MLHAPGRFIPVLLVVPLAAQGAAPAGYGFAGFEIYKFDDGIRELACGDFDGDGSSDIALVNNARSRIEILRRLPSGEPDHASELDGADTGNPLRFDGRFEIRRHPVERQVVELACGDTDGDGRSELVFALDGGEIVLLDELEAQPKATRARMDELRAGCSLLTTADLDGDGAAECLAAGQDGLYSFSGKPDGFARATLLDRLESALAQVFAVDFDGDRANDLLYLYFEQDYPLRIRHGLGGGRFGPRFDAELPQIRGASTADLDGDGASEVLAIFKLSGRLSVLAPDRQSTATRMLARTTLGKRDKDAERGFAVGDLTGDGAAEIVVAEPGAARVLVFEADRSTRAFRSSAFPSLVDAAQPCIGDLDGDGKNELVVVSAPERMVGVARLDAERRLPFPSTLPVDGQPGALELADLDGDGCAEICAVATTGEGRGRTAKLHVWRGSREGPVSPPTSTTIEGLTKEPKALRAFDLDRDGRTDLALFLPGESEVPLFFIQRQDQSFAISRKTGESAPGMGVLAGAGPERIAAADLDGDGRAELLVAARNFARVQWFPRAADLVFEPEIVEQLNGPASDSRISGVVALDWNADGRLEIALRDEKTREILIVERAEDGQRLLARLDAGRIDFRGLACADVDGDGKKDLVVLGENELGVCSAGERSPLLTERAAYESPRSQVFLQRVVAGDLNGDARPEVVATEVIQNSLIVLAYSSEERALRHALGFRVFEQSALAEEELELEPREALAADFDADKKHDLAVLVHDKLIVYLAE